MRVHRPGVRVPANPRRANEITVNKINASMPILRFRYRQSFTAAARSGYRAISPVVPVNLYVTVHITLDRSTGLLSDSLHYSGKTTALFLITPNRTASCQFPGRTKWGSGVSPKTVKLGIGECRRTHEAHHGRGPRGHISVPQCLFLTPTASGRTATKDSAEERRPRRNVRERCHYITLPTDLPRRR